MSSLRIVFLALVLFFGIMRAEAGDLESRVEVAIADNGDTYSVGILTSLPLAGLEEYFSKIDTLEIAGNPLCGTKPEEIWGDNLTRRLHHSIVYYSFAVEILAYYVFVIFFAIVLYFEKCTQSEVRNLLAGVFLGLVALSMFILSTMPNYNYRYYSILRVVSGSHEISGTVLCGGFQGIEMQSTERESLHMFYFCLDVKKGNGNIVEQMADIFTVDCVFKADVTIDYFGVLLVKSGCVTPVYDSTLSGGLFCRDFPERDSYLSAVEYETGQAVPRGGVEIVEKEYRVPFLARFSHRTGCVYFYYMFHVVALFLASLLARRIVRSKKSRSIFYALIPAADDMWMMTSGAADRKQSLRYALAKTGIVYAMYVCAALVLL
jgi:hypothetical protein